MLRSVNVKDYMLHDPVIVKADESIFEAIHKILMNKLSGISVVGEGNVLMGVLSEMDCLRAILGSVYNETPDAGKIEEHMTTEVISVGMYENVVDVAADMLKYKHRRRPVIDDEGKLVGQISCRRILHAVKGFTDSVDPTEQ